MLQALDYKAFQPTRDYLQDVAKVLGKAQQLFLAPEPHDWQRGLEVTNDGIATQEFELNGQPTRFLVNLQHNLVQVGDSRWELGKHSAEGMFDQLVTWLKQHDIKKPLEKPEFTTTKPAFDPEEATNLFKALTWVNKQLKTFKSSLPNDYSSPVLLFPHHFDLSYVWFYDRQESKNSNEGRQLGFGFSTGDENITEPYLYITQYPQKPGFTDLKLPEPAFWQIEGFTGAVLKYNDLAKSDAPENLVQTYFGAIHEYGRKLFEQNA